MNSRTEESICAEISVIVAIAYSDRTTEVKIRLNDLEAEIRRRHRARLHGTSIIIMSEPMALPYCVLYVPCFLSSRRILLLSFDDALQFDEKFSL